MNMNISDIWPGWRTVRKIGTGSFGTVYEIERDFFGEREKAAVKVITIPHNQYEVEELRNDGYDDKSITIRFESYLKEIVHEYSLMVKMKGISNTVYCDDIKYVRNEDGIGWIIYIKMELLTPLVKTLQSVSNERQILKLAHDLCTALVMCKQFNIVHRDIKPQNIFVSKDGTFKLGDFGIAKTTDRTTSGTIVGTYKYMAPEVYNNQPYGSSADIYSLGLVLYWLLNERRTPFLPLPPQVPTAGMEEEARKRRFQGDAIPAPKDGSPELKQIVLKACAYHLNDRFHSAEEMLSAVDRLIAISNKTPHIPPVGTDKDEKNKLKQSGSGDRSDSSAEKEAQNDIIDEDQVKTELASLQSLNSQLLSGSKTGKRANTIDLVSSAQKEESAAKQDKPPENKDKQKEKFHLSPRKTKKEEAKSKKPAVDSDSSGEPKRKKPKKDTFKKPPKKEEPKETPEEPELKVPTDEAEKKRKKTRTIAVAAGLAAAVIGGAVLLFTGGNGARRFQADWTDWDDQLPKYVTEKDYTIEERTLYSTRQLETTQSTENNQMAGWELYDTAEGNGDFGAWSDWSEEEVKPTDTREVETQLFYRFSVKQTAESDTDTMPGWTLEKTTNEWGEYGEWSDWSQNAMSESDDREVQTRTQYRYRNKETTTSSSASLSGWTRYDVTTTGGNWGAWSSWSSNPIYGSDSVQVDTKTQYSYRDKSYTTSTSSSMSGWTQYNSSIEYGPWSGWSEAPVAANDSIDVETKEETVESGGVTYSQQYYRYRDIYRTYQYYTWGPWSDYSDSPVSAGGDREVRTITLYRSRTRSQSTSTYKYYRWTDWSDWSTNPVSKTDSRDVQTQTSYRYRDRKSIKTYHFYRWTPWSEWAEWKAIKTDDRKTQTKTFYRFRDRVFETTYYFRTWTDWTEYSEKPAEPSETLQVQTKTQYRYRSINAVEESAQDDPGENEPETPEPDSTLSNEKQEDLNRYEFVTEKCSWLDAQARAAEKGGKLACFETQEEYEQFLAVLEKSGEKNTGYNIGGRRTSDSKDYYWVDAELNPYGDPLNSDEAWCKAQWLTGEPTFDWNDASETAIELYFSEKENRWVWNDIGEDLSRSSLAQYGYIIEYD